PADPPLPDAPALEGWPATLPTPALGIGAGAEPAPLSEQPAPSHAVSRHPTSASHQRRIAMLMHTMLLRQRPQHVVETRAPLRNFTASMEKQRGIAR
ncbi:MAG: hypothetical protein M3020_25085, partial [Myxococcota bacterium]|nr:hypothetical protein [Myxococcota bacterium]